MPHGHSHGHAGDEADLHIPLQLRRYLALAVVPIVVATIVGLLVLWPSGRGPNISAVLGQSGDLVRATVVRVQTEPCIGSPEDSPDRCQHLRVRITSSRHVPPDTGRSA